jgi:hypothetical protein
MLFGKLLEEVYIAVGLQVLRRVATGGSTTTVVDSGYANRKGDGFYAQGANGGHILFISQTTDDGAPVNQFGEISTYTLSTATPTFTIPVLSAAVGAGDIYAVMKPQVPLYEMIGRVNEGLRRLGEIERVDTTLTGLSNTLAYNLPAGIRKSNLLQIEIGNDTDGWRDAGGFSITPKSGSTQDQLIFTHYPPFDSATAANQTFKIRFRGVHPSMSVYSDSIEKSVHDELAIALCAETVMEHIMNKRTGSYNDKTKIAFYSNIVKRSEAAQIKHPIRIQPGTHRQRINLGEL